MGSSLSDKARDDLERAEAVRCGAGDFTFASVKHALRFYFHRGEAMQSPLGAHPRGEVAHTGSPARRRQAKHDESDGVPRVYVAVDGGKGSSADEIHATLLTIRSCMHMLSDDKLAHDILVLSHKDGLSLTGVGEAMGMAASSCSVHLARAEGILYGYLRRAEVIHGGGRVGR